MSDTLQHSTEAERQQLARLHELLRGAPAALVAVVVRPIASTAMTPTAIANAGARELRAAIEELQRQLRALEQAQEDREVRRGRLPYRDD